MVDQEVVKGYVGYQDNEFLSCSKAKGVEGEDKKVKLERVWSGGGE